MSTSIVTNQRRAYLALAQDTARELASRLRNLSPAQQAGILASCAAEAGCPIDITFTTEHHGDALDAATILDGDLAQSDDASWAWKVGSGCTFIVDVTR